MANLVLLLCSLLSVSAAPTTWVKLRNLQHFDALHESIGEGGILVSGFFDDSADGEHASQLLKEAHDTQATIFAEDKVGMKHTPRVFTHSTNQVLAKDLCHDADVQLPDKRSQAACVLIQKASPDGSSGWMASTTDVSDLDSLTTFLQTQAARSVPNYKEEL